MPPVTPSAGVLRVDATSAPAAPDRPATDNLRLAGWGGGSAALAVGAAHVAGAGVVDPVADPVSFYAFVPGGAALVLAGCVALGLLGVVLVARGYGAGLLHGPVPVAAVAVFALSMVLIGVFPTDPPGTAVASASAVVHRASAATAFCVLPLVVLGSSRGQGAAARHLEPLRRAGSALLMLVLAFLAIHLPLAAFGSSVVAFGLLERVGLLLLGAYLTLFAVQLDRHLSGPAAPAG